MADVELILLQRVEKLGQMGDLVKVRPGFARNFLLPQKKALRASKDNLARFEQERAQLEAQNLKRREEAEFRIGCRLIIGEMQEIYISIASSLDTKEWWPSELELGMKAWEEHRHVLASYLPYEEWRAVRSAIAPREGSAPLEGMGSALASPGAS